MTGFLVFVVGVVAAGCLGYLRGHAKGWATGYNRGVIVRQPRPLSWKVTR